MIADQVRGSIVGSYFNVKICHASDTHVYLVSCSVVMVSCKKSSSGGDNNAVADGFQDVKA